MHENDIPRVTRRGEPQFALIDRWNWYGIYLQAPKQVEQRGKLDSHWSAVERLKAVLILDPEGSSD